MRWLKVAVPLAALGVFVAQVAQANVPAFARQTGLTCNQCHVGISNNPDHTFTGVKFRLNGYRTPWIGGILEAGEEGAVNGRRLVLGLENRTSWHVRTQLATQSKGSSDPRLGEPEAGPISSNPYQSAAFHFVGPITEHVGAWNEFYFTGQGSNSDNTKVGFVRMSSYQINMAFNPGGAGNIAGVFLSQEGHTNQFGGQLTGVSSNQNRGADSEQMFFGAYAWVRDRVALILGIKTGEDNLDYKRMNYVASLNIMPMNTDATWVMLVTTAYVGNDMIPQVSQMAVAPRSSAPITASEAVTGVSATRAGGQPYASAAMGDAMRLLFDFRYGFVDKGLHSFTGSAAAAIENETYNDGAKVERTAIGTKVRYYYNRTFGINVQVQKNLKQDFTDQTGVLHTIPHDPQFEVILAYRQAQNFVWELFYSNSQKSILDQNWRNGWQWQLKWHYLW
jgi:hypothetical protein